MGKFLRYAVMGLLIGMCATMGAAEEVTREHILELDSQIQSLKKEVLDISTGLIQIEEKLIYPTNTQLSIFLAVAQGDKFHLDAVNIKVDGKKAAQYIYTSRELEALQHGGVQRIYTGNILTGEHSLQVELTGKSTSNVDYQHKADFKFTKDLGRKIVEITLAGPGSANPGISFKD